MDYSSHLQEQGKLCVYSVPHASGVSLSAGNISRPMWAVLGDIRGSLSLTCRCKTDKRLRPVWEGSPGCRSQRREVLNGCGGVWVRRKGGGGGWGVAPCVSHTWVRILSP